jgi:hypothetical protein
MKTKGKDSSNSKNKFVNNVKGSSKEANTNTNGSKEDSIRLVFEMFQLP